MATFAERLLLLREEKHVSQSVAANASGINLRTYHRYENGERRPPSAR
ncbi:MAG: helix-turn-helix domain-containing protein [Flavonifractor plautii]